MSWFRNARTVHWPGAARRASSLPPVVFPGRARNSPRPERADTARSEYRVRRPGAVGDAACLGLASFGVWPRAICGRRQPRQPWLPRTWPSPAGADCLRNGRRAGGPARVWRCRISSTVRRPPVRRPVAGHGRTRPVGRSGPAHAGCRQRDVSWHARDRPRGACACKPRMCGHLPQDDGVRSASTIRLPGAIQRGGGVAHDPAGVCPDRSRAWRIPRSWRRGWERRTAGRHRRTDRRVSASSCGRRTCPWPPNRSAALRIGIRARYI